MVQSLKVKTRSWVRALWVASAGMGVGASAEAFQSESADLIICEAQYEEATGLMTYHAEVRKGGVNGRSIEVPRDSLQVDGVAMSKSKVEGSTVYTLSKKVPSPQARIPGCSYTGGAEIQNIPLFMSVPRFESFDTEKISIAQGLELQLSSTKPNPTLEYLQIDVVDLETQAVIGSWASQADDDFQIKISFDRNATPGSHYELRAVSGQWLAHGPGGAGMDWLTVTRAAAIPAKLTLRP